jgi:hypothetical protein
MTLSKKCFRRTIKQKTAIFLGFVIAIMVSTGCQHTVTPASVGDQFMAIGAIRSNLIAEQEELYRLLKANGIRMSLDGSRMLDILVEEAAAGRALRILQTNRLVLEGKVILSSSQATKYRS